MTKTPAKCPLCGEPAFATSTEPSIYDCELCGRFEADRHVLVVLNDVKDKTTLSGVCREQFENDKQVSLTIENLDVWTSLAPATNDVAAKARKLLSYLARKTRYLGDDMLFDMDKNRFTCFARNWREVFYLLTFLQERRWVKLRMLGGKEQQVTVEPAGWQELRASENSRGEQGFVAMAFCEELVPVYRDGLRVGIYQAGFGAFRTDQEQFNSKIDDLIISEIRRSRFLVADVTYGRNGVFFEAGFAMGLGLPVVWTCRKGDEEFMHFDTRQYNHIIWTSSADLAEQLKLRILATIGKGPLDVDGLMKSER